MPACWIEARLERQERLGFGRGRAPALLGRPAGAAATTPKAEQSEQPPAAERRLLRRSAFEVATNWSLDVDAGLRSGGRDRSSRRRHRARGLGPGATRSRTISELSGGRGFVGCVAVCATAAAGFCATGVCRGRLGRCRHRFWIEFGVGRRDRLGQRLGDCDWRFRVRSVGSALAGLPLEPCQLERSRSRCSRRLCLGSGRSRINRVRTASRR